MTKQQAKQEIGKLKKLISYHRYLYHVLDRQEISDGALDSLKHRLYKLEQQYPEFITPDSPTQRIAGEPLKGFAKVRHDPPMLSIEDVFSEEEIKEWEKYILKLRPGQNIEYFAELKIDGFGISLLYRNGIFVCGSTRGNGKVGEDVTQNLKTIESIPLRLEIHDPQKFPTEKIRKRTDELTQKGEIEIRGEVYMDKKDFNKVNKEMKKKGKKTYSNPRNLAAGSIRQLDPKLAASRPLKFLAYDLITDLGQTKHSEEHQIMPLLGFRTDKGIICKNLDEAVNFWRRVAKKRDTLPFQIDGIVVNINDNKLFQSLGVAGKSPRGVRALKFSPKQATTVVEDVKFQVGRTGAITPVACLKPVRVGGTLISRATLHNEEQIKRLGLKIGDTVIVERAGDVIPAVVKVFPELRVGKEKAVHFPKRCPICGAKLVKKKGEVIWRCPNPNCPARKRRFLYNFTSKKGFDVDGLGPKVIDQLMDEGIISWAPDIFELKEGDLLPLERFAQKSASKLIQSIQKSKIISLDHFIYSLSIRHVGEKTAVELARKFSTIDNLGKASLNDLESISDIGPEASEAIYHWFHTKRNRDFLVRLRRVGIKIINESRGTRLKGKSFVITGALRNYSRQAIKDVIVDLGGEVSNSISKNIDYLILGKNPGSKLEKAKKLGVKIIGEKDFLKIINRK